MSDDLIRKPVTEIWPVLNTRINSVEPSTMPELQESGERVGGRIETLMPLGAGGAVAPTESTEVVTSKDVEVGEVVDTRTGEEETHGVPESADSITTIADEKEEGFIKKVGEAHSKT